MKISRFVLFEALLLAPMLAGVGLLLYNNVIPGPADGTCPCRLDYLYYLAAAVPAVANLAGYAIAHSAHRRDSPLFFQFFYSSLLIKSGISLVFILSVALLESPNLFWFVGIFFVSYFTFSAFEVRTLLANLQPKIKKPGNDLP